MTRPRIAVIGAGIAGLGAAYSLDRSGACEVTLIEAEQWIGGHTRTIDVEEAGGTLPVDMGFIVHNPRAYPRLIALFDELGVATRATEMSFSVSCRGCGLEYAGRAISRQLDRFVRPRMVSLVREMRRFWADATSALDDPSLEAMTLADFVERHGYSRDLVRHYLVPLTAAIWSTPPTGALDFPARSALAFLDNHGVLQLRGHQWRTVIGGSRAYVDAILERFGGEVVASAPVLDVRRHDEGVDVLLAGADAPRRFDHVLLATHADTSLALLADADELERSLLGSFEFTQNETILHRDPSVLPRRASTVAAWNYQLPSCDGHAPDQRPTMTYSMNRLQGFETDAPLAVTLNRGTDIDESLVVARHHFSHPRYTHRSLAAQQRIDELDGRRRTWFCGAWQGHGFHEDGLRSGQLAADSLLERLVGPGVQLDRSGR